MEHIMKKIVFTGGGTAGHVMPNLALIPYLNNYEIFYIGGSGIEKDIIKKQSNITYFEIPTTKLKRSLSLSNLLIPFKLIKSITEAKKILRKIKPDIIFSKGGFVSVPVCIAGHNLKIPVITHESDYSLGLANKIISNVADKVLYSFNINLKKGKKHIYTGTPIRRSLKYGNKNNIKGYDLLSKSKKTILVFGGSLGAKAINDFIISNIDKILNKYNIILISGKGKTHAINKPHFLEVEYAENISDYFDASDYIVSRAGSNAIFEILALNKKALLIPLTTSSRGEQLDNAMYFKNKNKVDVLLEKDLDIDTFLTKLSLLDNLEPSKLDIDKTNLKIVKEINSLV